MTKWRKGRMHARGLLCLSKYAFPPRHKTTLCISHLSLQLVSWKHRSSSGQRNVNKGHDASSAPGPQTPSFLPSPSNGQMERILSGVTKMEGACVLELLYGAELLLQPPQNRDVSNILVHSVKFPGSYLSQQLASVTLNRWEQCKWKYRIKEKR